MSNTFLGNFNRKCLIFTVKSGSVSSELMTFLLSYTWWNNIE